MFAYCLNNCVNLEDSCGTNAEAIQYSWVYLAGLLSFLDGPLPFADILLVVGLYHMGDALFSSDKAKTNPTNGDVHISYGPTPPNPDDEDEDEDYYDIEDNFGGRQRIGNNKGETPRSNRAQNKQFKDATKGLSPQQKRRVHDAISKKGYGYHGIKDIINTIK